MDFFLELITDLGLKILEKVTRRNTGKRTQTVVDILVSAVFLLMVNGFAIWKAVSHYRSGNLLAAAIFASAVVLCVLLLGFIVIRRIIRNRKNKIEP